MSHYLETTGSWYYEVTTVRSYSCVRIYESIKADKGHISLQAALTWTFYCTDEDIQKNK